MTWRGLAGVIIALVLCAAPAGAQQVLCQRGMREVTRVDFTGNSTFRDDQLAARIVTTQSSWARRFLRVVGQRLCYDSTVVQADANRLMYLHFLRGFRGTKVRPVITDSSADHVKIRFEINEGKPLLIDSLAVNGLDSVPGRERILRGLPLRLGDRMDRTLLDATRDTITRRLRNSGYPEAEVLRNIDTDTAALRAKVWYDAAPGLRMRIGSIAITVTKAPESGKRIGVHPGKVRETLGLDSGQVFSQRDLEGVKRGLYLTEAFQHVDVSVDSASLEDAVDSLVTVNVTLIEGDLHGARTSFGWGNYDCLRMQGNVATVNFLGGLRRVDLTGRVSRIGAGRPFDFAKGFCPEDVRNDLLSSRLNYYIGATYTQPPLFGRRAFPSLTIFSERRSEFLTYLKETQYGGFASLQLGGRIPLSSSYQLEYGKTRAAPAYFCGVFNVCDPLTYSELADKDRRTGVVGLSAVRSTANDLADPSVGSVVRAELRHSSDATFSDNFVNFTRTSLDAALYVSLPNESRLVMRFRGGTVLSDRTLAGVQRFIPPQERMYAGGPNSVRGFGPNQLGSLVYQVADTAEFVAVTDSVATYYRARTDRDLNRRKPDQPTGGDNVVVLNAELRVRSPIYPELLQFAAFVDAGDVWNRRAPSVRSSFRQLKATPGLGMRVFSPIGPLRVDIAYGPKRLPDGPVYFIENRVGNPNRGKVFCVSPGNTLAIRDLGSGVLEQDAGRCPASLAPRLPGTFLKRLVFNFSIGQPF
ncbi:MAG: BamA/OMP85 family outer membrane protein [Gemmatimonadaceae bacterium]